MSQISPTHPRRLTDVTHFDIETDVAVVGFGGAGGCAAIEAADAGADVTIFEVASASGGSMRPGGTADAIDARPRPPN